MTLTAQDYQNIASIITESENTLEYIKGNESLFIDYELSYNGYKEDDYFNGTGAFVTTSVNFSVMSADMWDEDGCEIECTFDEKELTKYIY